VSTLVLETPILPACEAELIRLSRVLSAAFADNPVSDWLFDGYQDHFHPEFFAAFLSWAHRAGRIEQSADGTAVAVWIDYTSPPDTQMLAVFEQAVHRAVGPYLPRWRAFDHACSTDHPTEPHWWLAFLGVLPEHRGRGHGRHLLEHATSWLDDSPAYLEATSRRLVGFYEHRGYVSANDIRVPEGPNLWGMRRT